MFQNKFYTVCIITCCVLILIGFLRNFSHVNFPNKFKKSSQVSTITPIGTEIKPISDEEDLARPPVETEGVAMLPYVTPAETVLEPKAQTKQPENTSPQKPVGETPTVKCPTGNNLPGYSYLSPVSPTFGLDYYRPTDLVAIPSGDISTPRTICVRSDTLDALNLMYTAMAIENLKPMIVSGFRSSTYQKKIQHKNISQTLAEGVTVRSVALPHHSEHQLGTTVDFAAAPAYNIRDFEKTPEYAWMVLHAAKYGFVQSYHYGDEPLTGYRGEPWHWRYIGPTHAQSVQTTGKILFQYLEDLIENSEIKNPS
jgi:LAS superfamily LD-carboxypeptidase LdcB